MAARHRIVLAIVAFCLRRGTTKEHGISAISAATSRFVDKVSEYASVQLAAVHSYVGDELVVSWNAASRVSQPEARAGRFLARLKADPGHPDVLVGGAAYSGSARVQLAGTSARQQAITVNTKWMPVLREMAALGAEFNTFFVDHHLSAESDFAIKTRGVGGVVYRRSVAAVRRQDQALPAVNDVDEPSPSGPFTVPIGDDEATLNRRAVRNSFAANKRIGLFEVLEEIAVEDWFHELDYGETSGTPAGFEGSPFARQTLQNQLATRAVVAWIDGRQDEANAAADRVLGSDNNNSDLVDFVIASLLGTVSSTRSLA